MDPLIAAFLFVNETRTGLSVALVKKCGSKPLVNDILTEQAQAILVVESPHHKEMAAGIPLSGVSGRVVSRVLIGMDSPVGPLCQAGQVKLSIVNTFRQPLKSDTADEQRPTLLREINSLTYREETYKDELKRIIQESQDTQMVDDYSRRVSAALAITPSKRLVLCGVIAQSFFEYAFGVHQRFFTRPFNCKVGSHEVQVLYVWHPSPKSGKDRRSTWENPDNVEAISRLKNFVSASTLLSSDPEQDSFSKGEKSMNKIVRVEVTLDDNVPEYMDGIIRCGAVQSFDAQGELIKDHQDMVDNTEYRSRNALISDIADRLKVARDIIVICE